MSLVGGTGGGTAAAFSVLTLHHPDPSARVATTGRGASLGPECSTSAVGGPGRQSAS